MSDDAAPPSGDRALILGRVDADGVAILRKRDAVAEVEAGVVRPLRQGQPITGEVLRLTPTADEPRLCDVKVELPAPTQPARHGPPKVATTAYRDGWDAIFGVPAGARDRDAN